MSWHDDPHGLPHKQWLDFMSGKRQERVEKMSPQARQAYENILSIRRQIGDVDFGWVMQADSISAMLSIADWMLKRLAARDHGCLTGDCPHNCQSQCIRKLVDDFLADPGKKGGDA